ncbi:MAG: glycosyltransferase family 39 protein [Comamonadaceae bacterium]|nr:glycosyltransferase family 39 protein [Comamonadaceae bacterium]
MLRLVGRAMPAGARSAGMARPTEVLFAPAYTPQPRKKVERSEADVLRRGFYFLLFATLAFRLWLAQVTPITGDEAYFIYWGRWPDWGFYDHPPMIGWWLALLLKFHDAEWWLRLPIVVLPAILAFATAAFLQRHDAARAWLAATLVLLAPVDVAGVFITTDTPLIYFSFFSALAFLRAARDDDPRFYLLAGVLLGGAFLAKYFALLLGIAYAAHVLYRPNRRTSSSACCCWCWARCPGRCSTSGGTWATAGPTSCSTSTTAMAVPAGRGRHRRSTP